MKYKEQIKKIVPSSLLRLRLIVKEKIALNRIEKNVAPLNIQNLRYIDKSGLEEFFLSTKLDEDWQTLSQEIAQLDITGSANGVNFGDRRALCYLIRYLQPNSVLEIGTHIGASTTHIAAALQSAQASSGKAPQLTTVDIVNVNDTINGPWITQGSTYSPVEMLTKMNCSHFVTFVKNNSLEYLHACNEKYDLIFLDGDHSAKCVYQEICAALPMLRPDGVILLHDYFPKNMPLWSNKTIIPGPHLAITRLQSEGINIEAQPLGELPWPTKLGSNITSLALLQRI